MTHRPVSWAARLSLLLILAIGSTLGAARSVEAQNVRIADLTRGAHEVPVRLVGYGLVTGLDGTGDRAIGGFGAGHTVRSIANLLRRFGVEVPDDLLRTLNVAAVLVTAEVSPFLRPGGRFDVQVASLGDATSLSGGVLWMTPLLDGIRSTPLATAQGGVQTGSFDAQQGWDRPAGRVVETSARIAAGGLLEQMLPRPEGVEGDGLILLQPNLGTSVAIAQAVNVALGEGTAIPRDPGAVELDLSAVPEVERLAVLSSIGELRVSPTRDARVVIDGRDGTVVTGGDITVGPAVVSHSGITLTISSAIAGTEATPRQLPVDTLGTGVGGAAGFDPMGAQGVYVPGAIRVTSGVSAQELADALHEVGVPAEGMASIFESLARVGAVSAEVVVR